MMSHLFEGSKIANHTILEIKVISNVYLLLIYASECVCVCVCVFDGRTGATVLL